MNTSPGMQRQVRAKDLALTQDINKRRSGRELSQPAWEFFIVLAYCFLTGIFFSYWILTDIQTLLNITSSTLKCISDPNIIVEAGMERSHLKWSSEPHRKTCLSKRGRSFPFHRVCGEKMWHWLTVVVMSFLVSAEMHANIFFLCLYFLTFFS